MQAPFVSIRYRPMRPSDVRECVELVAAHPVEGPRYGRSIADLRAAWLHVLAHEGFCATAVLEEQVGARVRIIAVGADVAVSDDFVRELKASPSFWIGPELTNRAARGNSPLLSERQFREANSCGGLNLAVWQATIRAKDMQRHDVGNALIVSFVDYHRGYLLKELVGQAANVEQFVAMRSSGGLLWNFAQSCYGELPENVQDIIRKPHVVGVTREMVFGRPGSWGSWVGSLFLYRPPRFGFTRSEQRLLLSALDGGTDEELSDKLSLSLTTVKKAWRAIYDRAAACIPDSNPRAEEVWPERGREKKHHLIAYLREHPEELRPVSRKLLQKSPHKSVSPESIRN
jgi:hypothetical protein